MKTKRFLTNSQIVDQLMKESECASGSQFANYLSHKYDMPISRQQISLFKKSDGFNLTSLLLREAMEKH